MQVTFYKGEEFNKKNSIRKPTGTSSFDKKLSC